MIYLQKNIRFLRRQRNLTQEQLANQLGLKRSLIGAYEEGRAVPKLLVIQQMALLFNVSIDKLLSVDVTIEKILPVQSNLKILTAVVDSDNRERISIVPVKASAGYLTGLSDPEYMVNLSHFAMPVAELSQEMTYRVFQISGDSMLPIPSGSYVFCNFVEDLSGIRDGKPYVIITADEGIVYKRVYNHAEVDQTLMLKSDNEAYKPYTIPVQQVLEVWQALGFLTFDLPEPNKMNMDKLSSMMFKMQDEIQQLKK